METSGIDYQPTKPAAKKSWWWIVVLLVSLSPILLFAALTIWVMSRL